MAHDFREGPGNDWKFARPISLFMRPAKPGGLVRLPFGGHAKAERAWSGGSGDVLHELALRSGGCFNTEFAESTERNGHAALFFAKPAVQDGLVGIDAAISEERPVAARLFALCGITFDDENFFFAVGGFGHNLPKRISDKGIAPKFEPGITVLRVPFESNTINHCGVHAIGNGVAALNSSPRLKLPCTELRLLVRMPADARRIEDHLSAAERSEA